MRLILTLIVSAIYGALIGTLVPNLIGFALALLGGFGIAYVFSESETEKENDV
jgi:uncharacterized membrane protein YccC